jgi:hypothetical protein
MQTSEDQVHSALLAARKERDDALPLLSEDLVKKLEGVYGETVQLKQDEPV